MEDKTMKKIYYQPTITVVNMKMNPLLAGSVQVGSNDYDSQQQKIGAKGGGFSWDDEESEGYDYEY